jgi:hypothetical protein
MSGRKDPTRITTFGLSKSDVVLKARQIWKTKMPANWKWGLQHLSRKCPPTSQVRPWGIPNIVSGMLKTVILTCCFLVQRRFPRILAEEPESFTPKRHYLDGEDPDPYVVGNVHKMGPTHSRRPITLLLLVSAVTTMIALSLRYLTHLIYLVFS